MHGRLVILGIAMFNIRSDVHWQAANEQFHLLRRGQVPSMVQDGMEVVGVVLDGGHEGQPGEFGQAHTMELRAETEIFKAL